MCLCYIGYLRIFTFYLASFTNVELLLKKYRMDNIALQVDEIEALSSIYGEDWHVEEASPQSYSIKIAEGPHEVTVYLTLPPEYPLTAPPSLQLLAPSLSRMQKQQVALALDDIYLENIGEPVIYQWIEKIRECLQITNGNTPPPLSAPPEEYQTDTVTSQEARDFHSPPVQHGDTIQDRKSVFQGHVAPVTSIQDVKDALEFLKSNKKIAHATHNIHAYRIRTNNNVLVQDCDDDGEHQAGGRLLHLLQILDVTNVLVVVTRWYGGIHLGPDRFRHINNAARQVLEQTGYLAKKK